MKEWSYGLKTLIVSLAILYWMNCPWEWLEWIVSIYLIFQCLNFVCWWLPRTSAALRGRRIRKDIEKQNRKAKKAQEREQQEWLKRQAAIPAMPQPEYKPPGPFDSVTEEYRGKLEYIDALPLSEKEKNKARETLHRLYGKKIEKLLE